jgi:hypothetical protein
MRRVWLVVVGLVAAGCAVYAGLWFHARGIVRDGLPGWAEAWRSQGYAVAWTSAAVEGFPFAFRLRLTGATIETARTLPASAALPELVLDATPWNLRDWRFHAPQGATFTTLLGAVGVNAATLDGTVVQSSGGTAVTLAAHTLAGTGLAQGAAADALDAQVTLPPQPPTGDRDPLFALSVKLADADLPQAPPPLSRRLDELSLAATMRGPLPQGPLDQALALWRNGGGTLDIDSARVAWGGMVVTLTGTLALDGAMQPEGALTATIEGGDRMIDQLVASGALKERFAGFARSVMRAIATPGEDGSKLSLPVTVQDQHVYVGPATVAALPHLTWR